MAKTLVSLAEIIAALEGAPKIDVAGEPHVEAGDLQRAIGPLVGLTPESINHQRHLDIVSGVATGRRIALDVPEVEMDPVTHLPVDPAFIAERERLALFPPGPCVCATRYPDRDPSEHLHPHGPCVGCADHSEPCTEYVDQTVRDPRQVRAESGVDVSPSAGPIQPRPEDLFYDPYEFRQERAGNFNAFRGPSGGRGPIDPNDGLG